MNDLRYACRHLLRNPGFTLVAVLALALGIGANTAIFSVVSAVLLRPLPFPEPERLVAVWENDTRRPSNSPTSYPNFEDWRARNAVFERLAVSRANDFTLTERGREAVHVQGAIVTADLFPLLRVNPALGRAFLPGEDEPGSRVAILSHGLWQKRFNSEKEALGRTVTVDGQPHQIVGVMPAGFRFPGQNEPVELWTTIAQHREKQPGSDETIAGQRGNHYLQAVARLKPGVSVEQAQANLNAIAAALAAQYPDSNSFHDTKIVPMLADLTAEVKPALLILLGAAGCVLLIACVNVANLLLARASARQKEIGIRAALGAGRWRIVRQLLTESVLLAMLGGAAGLLLALWGTEGITALLPVNFPRAGEIAPDLRVLAFTALVSLLTGVAFGLAPAWRVSRADPSAVLHESAGRGNTEGARGRRLRGALVIAELGLTFVLLVGAGLLLRSFWQLQRVPPGFDPRHVLAVNLDLPDAPDPQVPIRNAAFFRRLLERAAGLPGVRSVSAMNPLPFSGRNWQTGFDIAGRPTAPSDRPLSYMRAAAPGLFRTLAIPLRQGRDFDERDGYDAPGVVIVNETLARTYFPNENPLGKRITPQVSADIRDPREREIIGVVGDTKFRKLSTENKPELYLPHPQFAQGGMTLVLRAEGDPLALLPALRGVVGELDKDLPLYQPRTMEQYLATAVAQPRLNLALLAVFAAVAATLTAVGIYGVMAYAVAQRTPEIGIRLALGAQRFDVLRLVVGQGLWLTLAGITLGLLAALALTRLLASLLYGVGATDGLTLGVVAFLLGGIALLACWLPARRAAGLDPMTALRAE